jgi:hypothetical protein
MSKAEVLEALHSLTLEEILEVIEAASQQLKQLLFPSAPSSNIPEQELTGDRWEKAAATNPSFACLEDPEEDIYSLKDGEPVGSEKSTSYAA